VLLVSARNWAKAERNAAASIARAALATDRRMHNNPALGLSGGNCARCGAMTRQRTNGKTGEQFFGCTNYPRCTGSWKPLLA
jgi:hypothetical protein